MNKEFEKFLKKQRKLEPTEPFFWSMCKVLKGSGEDSASCYELFDEYMPKEEYDLKDREGMCVYLSDISKDTL